MEEKQPEVKRKPGRPRKKPIKPIPVKRGILEKPSVDGCVVEVVYDTPFNFKKLAGFFKSLNSEKIAFMFEPSGFSIFTKSWKDTNDVKIICDASKMTSYFCAERREVYVKFVNLEIVWNKLDRSYDSISICILEKDKAERMHIILQNEYGIPEYFEIDVILDYEKFKNVEAAFVEDEPPKIEFCIPGKFLKKTIADTKNYDKRWAIEMIGGQDLSFTYKSVNKQVGVRVVPNQTPAFNLRTTLTPGEIFSVSAFISNIKPTSTNVLAETLTIRAWRERALWVVAQLDDVICIHVRIKIIDYRKEIEDR